MRKQACLTVAILLGLAVLAAGAPAPPPSAPQISLDGYDVALVDLDEPMTIKLADGRRETYEQAWLVRFHGRFPITTAALLKVFIGGKRIEEYGGFPGGLYFLVYTRERLDELAGAEISFQIEDRQAESSGRLFEPNRFAPFSAMPLEEALTRPAAAPTSP